MITPAFIVYGSWLMLRLCCGEEARVLSEQRLRLPDDETEADTYKNLMHVLTRSIRWDLIRQQYDQMVKCATALRLGTAQTEALLRRFTRHNVQHPTYKALAELGKAVKTIFLCRYLYSERCDAKSTKDSTSSSNGTVQPTSSFSPSAVSSQAIGAKTTRSVRSVCTCSRTAWSISTRS
jgi:hypothetical protein